MAGARRGVDVGVDIGGGKTALVVMEPSGSRIHRVQWPTRSGEGPEAIIEDLVEGLGRSLESVGRNALRVGIGICGQVARGSGVVRFAPNLVGWRDVPLQRRIGDALGVPVAVANDLKMIALGEWEHGGGRGADDVVVIFVGTGIGAAVISDGRLLLGHGGYAGEIGHTTVVVDGRLCSCGNHGCVEAYAAGWAIAERAREAVAAGAGGRLVELSGSIDRITAKTVAEAWRDGDELARRVVEDTGRYLAAAVGNVVNSFNPRRIVIGGGVVQGIPELVYAVRHHVASHGLDACLEQLEIVPAELGSYGGAVGAVTLARQLYPDADTVREGSL